MLFLVLVMFLFVGCVEVEEKGEIDEIENDVSVISVENKSIVAVDNIGVVVVDKNGGDTLSKNYAQDGDTIKKVISPIQISKSEKVQEGDLIISSGEYVIKDTNFKLRGNLIVNGTGKLIVQNSDLFFEQEYSQQFRVYIRDKARLEMKDVKLHTGGKWFNFQYEDLAHVVFNNVHGEDCCIPWHGASGDSEFFISDSTVGLTLSSNVKIVAVNSSLFFELVLTNVSGVFELPQGFKKKYDLSIGTLGNELGVMEIHAINSTFTDWGSTLDKNTNVTFVNSKMTIGLNAGSDWEKSNVVVQVADLKTKTYEDYFLVYDTNRLHLVNTFVRDWYPQAFNSAHVEIVDSDLADLQSNSGNAIIVVRNSVSSLAIARENVSYQFYDSTITGDVVAHDTAQIYLYDTKVDGVIKEVGGGKVFVDGKRYVSGR